jgi:hypothetical protein
VVEYPQYFSPAFSATLSALRLVCRNQTAAHRMVVELSLTFADLYEQIEMSFKESGFIVVMECPLWVKSRH